MHRQAELFLCGILLCLAFSPVSSGTNLGRLIKPDTVRHKPPSGYLRLNWVFHKWQEFAVCRATLCLPFQCHSWSPKTRLWDRQIMYLYLPFCFSAHLTLFHPLLTFIIQAPLPGANYIGQLRSSRPLPDLPHKDLQIFPFPVPLPLALWAHFCSRGTASIS